MWASTWSPAEWIDFSARFAWGVVTENQERAAVSTGGVRPAANLQRLEEVYCAADATPLEQEKRAAGAASGQPEKHWWTAAVTP